MYNTLTDCPLHSLPLCSDRDCSNPMLSWVNILDNMLQELYFTYQSKLIVETTPFWYTTFRLSRDAMSISYYRTVLSCLSECEYKSGNMGAVL
jgi:hypothetical protein